jgi:hypothetical protein
MRGSAIGLSATDAYEHAPVGDSDYLGGRQRSNTWSALTKLGELS